MATDSKYSLSYTNRLFLLIAFFTWTMTLAFFTLQYTREREYKADIIDAKLQLINTQIINDIHNHDGFDANELKELANEEGVRLSIIGYDGIVLFDTNSDSIKANHSNRKEVINAKQYGKGYMVRRASSTDNNDYFYSATRNDSIIVRTALPYNPSLVKSLKIDSIYFYLILIFAIFLTIIAYFASARVGKSILSLRNFATQVEKGEIANIDRLDFPNDELGDISQHIVSLYKNLQATAKERDRNLQNAIFEEQEKVRIKHQLTDNINHELKTPIHSIQACLETIENNHDQLPMETTLSLCHKAYSNVKRLSSLLADISVITRISDAPNQIKRENVNITEIVNDVVSNIEMMPEAKQMRLNISLPEKLDIYGNESLLDSIFRNLFVNAYAYSGGRDIFLTLDEQTDEYYKFTFADNGIGVDEEHLSRLFERFYRIDKGRSRASGGTGLGLSIVKNAVLFHNGTISVRNLPQGGLAFTFTLHK